jgi:hypothetical protein
MASNLRSRSTVANDANDADATTKPQTRPKKSKSTKSPPKISEEDEEAVTSEPLQTDQPSKQPIASSAVKKPSPATTARPATRSQATKVKDGANSEDAENAKHSEDVKHTTEIPSRLSSKSPKESGRNAFNPPDANLTALTSNSGELDTPRSPPDEEFLPQHHIVDPNGDLTIETSKGVTFLVSSAVLTQASGPLGDRIKFWRSEPATTKSPINTMHCDQDPYDIHRFFCLLHRVPDPESGYRLIDRKDDDLKRSVPSATMSLLNLARMTDKYQCHQSLGLISESLLSDFATPHSRDGLNFFWTTQAAAAAYLFRQPRYFRLFTKRLVTDHIEESEDFPDDVPKDQRSLIEAELAKQSSNSYTLIHNRINDFATDACAKETSCRLAKDNTLVQRITDSVLSPQEPEETWPTERSQGISLRLLLHGLYRLDRFQSISRCSNHRARTYGSVGGADFAKICEETDENFVTGLCLECIRSCKACDCQVDSVPYASALRFVRRDAYLLGAEPLPENRSAENSLTDVEGQGSPGVP